MSDLIDRQIAISAICNACGKIDCDKMDKCEKLQLPPANCSEFPNNSDTISRQAAINVLETTKRIASHGLHGGGVLRTFNDVLNSLINIINLLPQTQPERIKGHWIDTNIFFQNTCGQLVHEVYCDKCHGIAYFRRTNDAYVGASICPNCGADMRGEQNG